MNYNNLRCANSDDAKQLCEIYNYYVEHTCITFEEDAVSENDMKQRIGDVLKEYTWLVYEENNLIVGYAYFSKWKVRTAYRYCAESTVYLRKGYLGKGLGTFLYQELIKIAKDKKLHSLLGGITIPNDPSIKLHEKLGFIKVGQLKEVGFKQNRWLDVGYWELLL